jgi:hypothetical protein
VTPDAPHEPFAELTDLASYAPLARTLVQRAFAERLGEVTINFDFHRNWNGGWRCRATIAGRGTLEFVLLIAASGALVALPVPMPAGWRPNGVSDSADVRWTADDQGDVTRIGAV